MVGFFEVFDLDFFFELVTMVDFIMPPPFPFPLFSFFFLCASPTSNSCSTWTETT